MPKNNLSLLPYPKDLHQVGLDFAMAQLRLRGLDISYVQAYFETGVGPKGSNIQRLAALSQKIKVAGFPFLLVADFNMTPEELQTTGFLAWTNSSIVVAAGGVPTCRSGRLLDFIVATNSLIPAISQVTLVPAPWKTHDFISFRILRAPRQIEARFLVRPTRFAATERTTWQDQQAHFVPPTTANGLGHSPINWDHTVLSTAFSACEDNAKVYSQFTSEAEQFLAQKCDVQYSNAHCGRASFPRFVIRSVLRPSGGADRSNVKLTTWATIEAQLLLALQYLKHHKHFSRYVEATKFLTRIGQVLLEEQYHDDLTATEDLHLSLWEYRLCNIRKLPLATVQGMFVEAGRMRARESYRRENAIKKSVQAWARKAISGHASAGHKYLRDTNKPAEFLHTKDGIIFEPAEILQHKSQFWSALWTVKGPTVSLGRDYELQIGTKQLCTEFVQLRDTVLAQDIEVEPIRGTQLRRIAKRLDVNRGIGLDFWTPSELQMLEDRHFDQLAEIINRCERQLAPPLQALLSLIALLPKPMGGDRPVCLASMFYILWSAARNPDVEPFEKGFVQFWDNAIKGSSALRATLERKLYDELHILEGDVAFGMYWDIEKFYDSIRLVLLIQLAVQAGYPVHILAFDIMFHLAPRILKWNSAFSDFIPVTNGILAGAKRSGTFARIFLYPIIAAMHRQIPPQITTRLRLYADDIAQNVYGKLGQVMKAAVSLVRKLYSKLAAAALVVSPKSAAVCSHNQALQYIVSTLKKEGIPIRSARAIRDLGVDATAGTCRAVATAKARTAKVKRKAQRVRTLRKAAGQRKFRTSRFWGSNLWPTLEFGTPAFGLGNTALREARTTAAAMVQDKFGQCTHSVLQIGLGPWKDPEFLALRSSISFWLNFWSHADPALRTRLSLGWKRTLAAIHASPNRRVWNTVRGPMASLIASFERIGWETPLPNIWTSVDHNGDKWTHTFTGTGGTKVMLQAVAESISAAQLPPIERHWSGTGAAQGLHFPEVRAHWLKMLRHERYDDAARFLCITTGGCWPMGRRLQKGMPDHGDGLCPRCGKTIETDLHRFWQCDKNLIGDVPAIVNTQNLRRFAEKGSPALDIYWMRGIPTRKMFTFSEPESEYDVLQLGEVEALGLPEGNCLQIYSDGSGGKFSSIPLLRRCGWGWIALTDTLELDFARCSPLASLPQTVPRSELSAIIDCLQVIPAAQDADITLDAQVVQRTASTIAQLLRSSFDRASSHPALFSDNGDLWVDFLQALQKRTGWTAFHWCKSHATTTQIWSGYVSKRAFVGNTYADAFAGRAAELHQVEDSEKTAYDIIVARTRRIHNRLIAVLALIQEFENEQERERKRAEEAEPLARRAPRRRPELVSAPVRKNKKVEVDEFLEQFSSQGHQPKVVDTAHGFVVRCTQCKVHARKLDFKRVLALGPCVPIVPPVISPAATAAAFSGSRPASQILSDPLESSSRRRPISDVEAAQFSAPKRQSSSEASSPTLWSAPLLEQPPMVGKKRLHASHRLEHYRGIILCTRCVFFSVTRARELSRPCSGKPNINTKKHIDRWARGETPKAAQQWPEAFDSMPAGLIWRPV